MRINDILRKKGSTVITIDPEASVGELLDLLREHRIGAVVVSRGQGSVDGIVAERDLLQLIREDRGENRAVHEVMNTDVVTCGPDDDVESLAHTMTERRIRHLPVVTDGKLTAIVSIGDVVKHRLDDLQHERDQLESYVQRDR